MELMMARATMSGSPGFEIEVWKDRSTLGLLTFNGYMKVNTKGGHQTTKRPNRDSIILVFGISCSLILSSATRFWHFLATNFITDVAKMSGDFLGSGEKHCFLSQTGEATFWATFGKTWATFFFNIWSRWFSQMWDTQKFPAKHSEISIALLHYLRSSIEGKKTD